MTVFYCHPNRWVNCDQNWQIMHWLKNYNPLPRWMLWNILLVPVWVRLLMWSIPVYKLPVCKLKLANYALTQIITRFLNGCSKIDALVRKLGNNWSAFKTVRQSFNLAILVCLFCFAWFYTGSNKKQVNLGWIGTNLPGARKGELAPLEKVKHQLIVWTFEIVIVCNWWEHFLPFNGTCVICQV